MASLSENNSPASTELKENAHQRPQHLIVDAFFATSLLEFDGNLAETTWIRDDFIDSEEEIPLHNCLTYDDDPLVGIVSGTEVGLMCCATMTYLTIQSKNVKSQLTLFGRRMHSINTRRGYRLTNNLNAMLTWSIAERNRRLSQSFLLVDTDRVEWKFASCSVCFAACRFTRRPPCCGKATICQPCWKSYLKQLAADNSVIINVTGSYQLKCFACKKFVPYSEALACTDAEDLHLLRSPNQLATEAIRCPVCLEIVDGTFAGGLKKHRKQMGGTPFKCGRCGHDFCGACGLSKHPNFTCNQLTESDVGLKSWARLKHRTRPDFLNCRKCPSCKIKVSHSGGCGHMTCVCGTEFCYSCGQRYGFGVVQQIHTNKTFRLLPIVSCTSMWKSKKKRIAVQSCVSVGLVFVAAPIAIALLPVAVPAGFGAYLGQKLRNRLHRS